MKIKHLILIILYIIIQVLLKDVWLFVYKIQSLDLNIIEKNFNKLTTIIFGINFIILLLIATFNTFFLIMYTINTGKIKSFLNKKLF